HRGDRQEEAEQHDEHDAAELSRRDGGDADENADRRASRLPELQPAGLVEGGFIRHHVTWSALWADGISGAARVGAGRCHFVDPARRSSSVPWNPEKATRRMTSCATCSP